MMRHLPIEHIVGRGTIKSPLPFSPAVRAGGFLFVSGMASADENGAIVHDTFENEARRTYRNLAAALSADDARCVETNFATASESWQGLAWRESGAAAVGEVIAAAAEQKPQAALPEALGRPLPPQKSLPRPLSPSGAAAVIGARLGAIARLAITAGRVIVADPVAHDVTPSTAGAVLATFITVLDRAVDVTVAACRIRTGVALGLGEIVSTANDDDEYGEGEMAHEGENIPETRRSDVVLARTWRDRNRSNPLTRELGL